jgi:hypothetical protein
VPPQLVYFAGVGAVLAAIWVAQRGPLAQAAAARAEAGGGRKRGDDSGPEGILPDKQSAAYGSYQYNYGEQSGPDAASPYGGATDNSASQASVQQQPTAVNGYPGLTPVNPGVTTTFSRTGATIAPDVSTGGATYTPPKLTPVSPSVGTIVGGVGRA